MLQTGYVRATLSPIPSASETFTTSSTSLYAEQAQYHGVHAVDTRRHSMIRSAANCTTEFPSHTFKC